MGSLAGCHLVVLIGYASRHCEEFCCSAPNPRHRLVGVVDFHTGKVAVVAGNPLRIHTWVAFHIGQVENNARQAGGNAEQVAIRHRTPAGGLHLAAFRMRPVGATPGLLLTQVAVFHIGKATRSSRAVAAQGDVRIEKRSNPLRAHTHAFYIGQVAVRH